MIRDRRLRELSGDHKGFLAVARRARAAAADPDLAVAEWSRLKRQLPADLDPHLAFEQQVVLPALSQAGDRELVALAQADHATVRDCLGGDADPAESLVELADALEAHVRFDEQSLFETAQVRLDAIALAAKEAEADR